MRFTISKFILLNFLMSFPFLCFADGYKVVGKCSTRNTIDAGNPFVYVLGNSEPSGDWTGIQLSVVSSIAIFNDNLTDSNLNHLMGSLPKYEATPGIAAVGNRPEAIFWRQNGVDYRLTTGVAAKKTFVGSGRWSSHTSNVYPTCHFYY